MKAELTLPSELVKEIAKEVVELLKPVLSGNNKYEAEDVIFDVQGLTEYLNVTKKWIYEQTHLKTIPYLKISNKQLRFKKKDIDKWLEALKIPATSEPTGKPRLVR